MVHALWQWAKRFACALRWAWIGILVVLLCTPACKKKEPFQLPPATVEVTPVVQQDVPIYHEWIGSLDGMTNAAIRAQVSGYLLSQDYREGTLVNKDDVLFHIDPRPFQATLDQAKGTLGQAQAQLTKTQQDVDRYTPLAKTGAISQEELDNAIQANQAAKANVDAAKAAVEKAALELGFTKILAPVKGLAGLAQAQVGDLVGPTGGQLTTISTIDPIKVLFSISEQEYLQTLSFLPKRATRQEYQQTLELELLLPNGSTYPEKGKFYAIQRDVDPKTGTLQIVGIFPNPDYQLRPGQFARVRAQTNLRRGALLVPQRAVTELQSMYQVAVVDDKNTVQIRPVKVGERFGGQWIITEGLKPGERVVVEGLQKIQQGAVVDVKSYSPAPPALPATPAPTTAPGVAASAR